MHKKSLVIIYTQIALPEIKLSQAELFLPHNSQQLLKQKGSQVSLSLRCCALRSQIAGMLEVLWPVCAPQTQQQSFHCHSAGLWQWCDFLCHAHMWQ